MTNEEVKKTLHKEGEAKKVIIDATEEICQEISLSPIPNTEGVRLCKRIRAISGAAIKYIDSYAELLTAAEIFTLALSSETKANKEQTHMFTNRTTGG